VQDKALFIPFEESEACLSTMQTKVKEALALGPESSIVLTDSQGNLLIDTPGIKGLCCGLEYWNKFILKFAPAHQ